MALGLYEAFTFSATAAGTFLTKKGVPDMTAKVRTRSQTIYSVPDLIIK